MENTTESALTSATNATEELSPLEQDVLDEYERLAENMKKVHHAPSPFPTLPPLSIPHNWIGRWLIFVLVGRLTRQHGRTPDSRDFGRIAAVRAEDELGVYVAESERV